MVIYENTLCFVRGLDKLSDSLKKTIESNFYALRNKHEIFQWYWHNEEIISQIFLLVEILFSRIW